MGLSTLRGADGATILGACAVAAAVAFGVGLLVTLCLHWFARRTHLHVRWVAVWKSPIVALFVVLAIRTTLQRSGSSEEWIDPTIRVLDIVVVIAVGWILIVIVHVVEQALLSRFPQTGIQDRESRHARTQISFLRKVADALVVTGVVIAALWTVPGVRDVAIGLLASAGVVGIVFGLAAQTSLANLFSGIQIAFTDAIRVDDIVLIDGRYGRIEEITLTYVAVRVWDGTTLILPCTYFTTTPFNNWTHQGASTLGVVELALDWTVPVDEIRHVAQRAARESPHWDGQVLDVHVEDTSGPLVMITVTASATDGDECNALRWDLRETLLREVQARHADVLPRRRLELTDTAAPPPATNPHRGGIGWNVE
jgi:small-conductance mechanosensitive channel